VIEARAGTGKTTTLIEGLKIMRGQKSNFTPSPQQKAIWDAIALSKNTKTVCFVAFNKTIAEELQQRVPEGCQAMTMHSLGNKALYQAFGRLKLVDNRVDKILADEIYNQDIWELRKRKGPTIKAIKSLVSLCKMNLLGCTPDAKTFSIDRDELFDLASHHDIDLNGSSQEIFEKTMEVLLRCTKVEKDNSIDFNDMIWLPVVLNLPIFCHELLLVDEAQDLNRCQQALAKRAGQRLIFCGDPKQSIYGFAGADTESMPRLVEELSATARGCQTLPLTVTRRYGKAIVEEAQRFVPDFEAHETCPKGSIKKAAYPEKDSDKGYASLVEDGDMVLCRVNAPLVSQCFTFIRAGRKASIQGRRIGQGLISTIKKMKANNIDELIFKLDEWLATEEAKEQKRKFPNEGHIMNLQDRHMCIIYFTEGQTTIDGTIASIEKMFTDDDAIIGIKLSSIHKAKGLESDRVFLLQPEGASIPHPMAKTDWAREQEYNLLYVAITRAKEELVYVS